MQIIQSIRDKGAAIVIVVIALSLIGFILMDAKQGGNKLFSSLSSNIGKVNGQTIDMAEYNKRVKQAEDMQRQRGGTPQTNQVREQMWNQLVAERIFAAETEKLGIEFTSSELRDILLSNDQNNPFTKEQGMLDSATGKLDIGKAQQAINNIKKFKGEQREMVDAQIIDPLKLNTGITKYTGLLNASVYYPSWMQQKETTDAKNFATISYINLPYTDISDSTVKVTDAEINDYVQKHKEMFKQEEGRNISYVSFSQLANAADSARVSSYVGSLKEAFAADTNAKSFLSRNTSAMDFSDEFVPKSKIPTPQIADTLTKLPLGSVYGPFLDKSNYVLAKLIATKQLPDSVHARHILLPLQDQQTGRIIMEDSVAKKLADSILAAINGGADFAALALKYSSDGSKTTGGDLGTYEFGKMVPEFNDFSFTKPVGSRAVVKTQFGYHVIEILGQKGSNTAYKIGYMAKEINASDETIGKAQLEATKASNEKNAAGLAKYIEKNKLTLTPVAAMLKENDYRAGELQDARQLVRWAFEAKKGDISEPFSLGDQFIVAQLDKINEKGIEDAATARPKCESIIKNKKKAAILIKKIGNNPTLESVAAATNKQVQQAGLDSSLTITSQIINGLGLESKVIGAAFNKEYQTKLSPPIEGTTGVFLIKVNSVQSKPADTAEEMAAKATERKTSLRSQVNTWYQGLEKKADIKDNRSKYY